MELYTTSWAWRVTMTTVWDSTTRNHYWQWMRLFHLIPVMNNNDSDNDNDNNQPYLVRWPLTAELTNLWPSFPDWIGIWSVRFYGGRKTGEPREKPLEQGQEPTTNSTHMWRGSGKWTRNTVVGGKRSHQCAIHASGGGEGRGVTQNKKDGGTWHIFWSLKKWF